MIQVRFVFFLIYSLDLWNLSYWRISVHWCWHSVLICRSTCWTRAYNRSICCGYGGCSVCYNNMFPLMSRQRHQDEMLTRLKFMQYSVSLVAAKFQSTLKLEMVGGDSGRCWWAQHTRQHNRSTRKYAIHWPD
jgi:hypothetical protein